MSPPGRRGGPQPPGLPCGMETPCAIPRVNRAKRRHAPGPKKALWRTPATFSFRRADARGVQAGLRVPYGSRLFRMTKPSPGQASRFPGPEVPLGPHRLPGRLFTRLDYGARAQARGGGPRTPAPPRDLPPGLPQDPPPSPAQITHPSHSPARVSVGARPLQALRETAQTRQGGIFLNTKLF